MKRLEHHYYEERMRGLGEHRQHCKGFKLWGELIFLLLYMPDPVFCVLWTGEEEVKMRRKDMGLRFSILHINLMFWNKGTLWMHMEVVILQTWKQVFFFPLWRLRILVQLVLDFNKFFTESCVQDYWPSCDLRENCSCQTVPLLVHMLHTADLRPKQRLTVGGNTAFLLFVTFIIYYWY